MDRAYDSQSKKFLVKETIPKTEPSKRVLTKNNKDKKTNNCSTTTTSNGNIVDNKKKDIFSTHPLDEAMQELLDICQQYNDKLASNKKQQQDSSTDHKLSIMKATTIQATTTNNENGDRDLSNTKTTCDTNELDKTNNVVHLEDNSSSQYAQNNFTPAPPLHHSRPSGGGSGIESIELLQEKQSDLQRQLDEVLLVAKKLNSKQKKNHLRDILEDDFEIQNIVKKDDGRQGDDVEEEEEEDELIEFQQIENELRISDLKRQLDNIQEELRIRLFKRLVSHTTGSKQSSSRTSPVAYSPSSSSCSDTNTNTTTHSPLASSNNGLNASQSNNVPIPKKAVINEIDRGTHKLDVTDGSASAEGPRRSQDIQVGTTNEVFQSITYKPPDQTSASTGIESNFSEHDSAVDYTEALTPTTSKESVLSRRNPSAYEEAMHCPSKDTMSSYQTVSPHVHTMNATSPVFPNNHRNNSANSDLERIEEDQEDEQEEQDFYCSSDKFRTIYEEKLSPKALGHVNQAEPDASYRTSLEKDVSDIYMSQNMHSQPSDDASKLISSQQLSNSSPHPGRYKVQKKQQQPIYEATNRPLTLYLPKPDEELDLVEHVQALGHDIEIISDDLKLSSKTAEGYLWKCCAKNTKKWMRRYFYYDRESQIVAYFKDQSQLTKKHPSPRDTIPFEEISDVYVDHRLSGLGSDKDTSSSSSSSLSKGKNFVFVLATIGRKYLLASSKAETMRAWIDILFTAAKANDYLEHLEPLDDDDDQDEFDDVNCELVARTKKELR